ncbi:MAG: RIP metalloprotease RseP [Magnetospirillum sp. WYHS-4]
MGLDSITGFLGNLWDYGVPFLVTLSVLVFVHELGHFWVARRNGVKVEVFSIGFGTELFGFNDRLGTRWKFSAVPLGGYVKMFGEYDFDEESPDRPPMTDAEKAVSFHHKRLGQRAAIVAAGPIANFLFAIAVLALMFMTVGNPHHQAGVGQVQPGSSAEQAGFQKGDLITAIDGEPTPRFEDLRRIVSAHPGQGLSFRLVRDGAEMTLQAVPKASVRADEDGRTREVGLLGVLPDPARVVYERHNPLSASWMAVEKSFGLATRILQEVGLMVSGSRNAEDLGGPLRIAQMSGKMAESGFVSLVFFMAALSVNLGLINLFPIPVLDGGHLLFYAAEAVRGRPLDARYQEYGFRFGLILVLLLMIFATWNDLVHLRVFEFIKNFLS